MTNALIDVRDRLHDPGLADRAVGLGFHGGDLTDLMQVVATVRCREDGLDAITVLTQRLVSRIGCFRSTLDDEVFAGVPDRRGPLGAGVLEMVALLVTAPEVADFHASRGVVPEVSVATLADLGQQVGLHRRTFGHFGLHTHSWLTVAWSGALYWLGRLQFNLQPEITRGQPEWVLSTHIPATGPLTPAGVDASFATASAFFAAHFPDQVMRRKPDFFCRSWLLDPALAAGLPGSNLAAFQRRWHLEGGPEPGDVDTLFFVFNRRPPVDLATLPRDTRLRRLTADRFAAGHGWGIFCGRLAEVPQ